MCSDTMRQFQLVAAVERGFEYVELQRAGGMICLLDTESCKKGLTRCLFPRALCKSTRQTLPFIAISPIFYLLLGSTLFSISWLLRHWQGWRSWKWSMSSVRASSAVPVSLCRSKASNPPVPACLAGQGWSNFSLNITLHTWWNRALLA